MADRVDVSPASTNATGAAPDHVVSQPNAGSTERVAVDPSKVQPGTSQNPGESLLAGKFKTPADLEKAYKELESRLGKSQETPQGSEAPKSPAESTKAAEIVQKAGLDMGALSREFASNGGELSPESLAKLSAAGISKETVDQFVAGQKALVTQYETKMATVVGGQENLQALLQWAGANLTEAEVVAVNEQLTSMDETKGKLALEGLKSRYVAANGLEPNLVSGENARSSGDTVKPFASMQEMADMMANPRYKTDPAYQNLVLQRMAAADVVRARVL